MQTFVAMPNISYFPVEQLDDLRLAEVQVEPLPEGIVGSLGIPDDRARVEERCLLAIVVAARALEVEQLVVIRLA